MKEGSALWEWELSAKDLAADKDPLGFRLP